MAQEGIGVASPTKMLRAKLAMDRKGMGEIETLGVSDYRSKSGGIPVVQTRHVEYPNTPGKTPRESCYFLAGITPNRPNVL